MRRVGLLIALLSALVPGGHAPLVTFGHSYAAGHYAGSAPAPWPEHLAAAEDRRLDNRAVGGTESAAVARAVDGYDPKPTDDVVIEAALNDVRDNGRRGAGPYAAALRRMLAHLTRGPRPRRIVVVLDPPIRDWGDKGSPEALAAYRAPTAALAARYGARFVDLGTGWDPRLIGPDGIHPGEAGAERIAQVVGEALR